MSKKIYFVYLIEYFLWWNPKYLFNNVTMQEEEENRIIRSKVYQRINFYFKQ